MSGPSTCFVPGDVAGVICPLRTPRPHSGLAQAAPSLLQSAEALASGPSHSRNRAALFFASKLAQAVTDQAQRVCGVNRLVQRLFHVEGQSDHLGEGGLFFARMRLPARLRGAAMANLLRIRQNRS